jgi:hypothetical protein
MNASSAEARAGALCSDHRKRFNLSLQPRQLECADL